MDKWTTNMSCDGMELSSDSDLSEIFGEIGYKGKNQNTYIKRRLLSSSSESDSENIEELPDIDPRQFLWSAQNLAPKVFDFDENLPGIKANIDDKSSILEIFQLYFSENIGVSNNYYTTKTVRSRHSRLMTWKNTTVTKMYRFFALSMLLSRVKKVSIEEYWSNDELLRTESFPRIMTKDRYKSLLQMLHFHDNNETTNQDMLIKIRSIIDRLRNSFSRVFYPYKYLCIDESLLLFKGRCFFKQYIPSKRSRFGIKSYVICDCYTGYILDFIVYCGARTDTTNNNHLAEIGKSGNIVMTLMETYLNKGHVSVTDNWYSSPIVNSINTVRKTLKWYKKFFFHMLDLSIYNAYILYKIIRCTNE
ncbi:PREDICTED: piggyBac transposable element-derived protein 4-like [Habropoda laboriosa]|uniref:piggyBac transposable element-derived protein 4-like n=1 Tax=Habropoda laboriosa TaxID=597456 RepID=UPI00083DCDE3|nr:PREDICTED: piggyBac transposable element-derived protein 4-like [Habropoda laboriosa]